MYAYEAAEILWAAHPIISRVAAYSDTALGSPAAAALLRLASDRIYVPAVKQAAYTQWQTAHDTPAQVARRLRLATTPATEAPLRALQAVMRYMEAVILYAEGSPAREFAPMLTAVQEAQALAAQAGALQQGAAV